MTLRDGMVVAALVEPLRIAERFRPPQAHTTPLRKEKEKDAGPPTLGKLRSDIPTRHVLLSGDAAQGRQEALGPRTRVCCYVSRCSFACMMMFFFLHLRIDIEGFERRGDWGATQNDKRENIPQFL